MRIYTPRNHRRRRPLATTLDNLAYDAKHAPAEFWAAMACLALFAALFFTACARRHSIVPPEDRTGLRTYEAR